MTSDPSSPKLLKLFILIASLLSWQQISLWITSANQREVMSWNLSLVEEFWGKTSAVTFQVEGNAVIWEPPSCTDGLRMLPSGPGSSSSLLYSPMFPSLLSLWLCGLTISKRRLVQPLTLSVPLITLPWEIFNRKRLQAMSMTMYTHLPYPTQTLE